MKEKNFLVKFIHKLDSINLGTGKVRDYFVENLSMLVASGMPLSEGIAAVEEEVKQKGIKRILKKLREDIDSGLPLWRAFEESGMFKEYTISLVRVGEESGRLSENLKLIAVQEQKDRSLKSKLRSAMMYPILVLSLTVVIGVAIAWFILPRLSTVFSQLRLELPPLTRGLISTGEFLREWGHIVLPAFIGGLVSIVFFTFFYSKTKFIGQTILFSIPGIKRLLQEIELTRFGYLLGTLLSAGLPVTVALSSLESATSFPQYKKFYNHLGSSIDEGNSFQKSFASYKKTKKLIPVPIQQLIVAGERSGNLSPTLIKVSENFEAKTEDTTKNLTVILEPILLVIVWLGVVGVALAVILPIYNLIGGLNTDPGQRAPEPIEIVPSVVVPIAIEVEEEVIILPQLQIDSDGLEYLNVRDEASGDGELLLRVLPGEVYDYRDEENGWYEIVLADGSGWVIGEYITLLTDEEAFLRISEGLEYLNVRSDPSGSSGVVIRVLPGERYEYTKKNDDWYLISLSGGRNGWVSGGYVDEIQDEE